MFGDAFRGKRVFVTGHTGFKGSWLTLWLLRLGARVTGYSLDVPTSPSLFEELRLAGRIEDLRGDVRDLAAVEAAMNDADPDFVFHLAAQAIVSTSFSEPVGTIATNVVGTMNVMDALRRRPRPCVAVIITSDKCYNNVEWPWGYRETDALGGADIYSGSKGAAELVIRSYVASFLAPGGHVRVGVGRAGNVLGGGDWAKDRIVADCIRAWSRGEKVEIRSPRATRPWQHVLEPLSGYLTLGRALAERSGLHGEAFNFGPRAEQNRTVGQLIETLATRWGLDAGEAFTVTGEVPFHEASLLKLNCDKALLHLKWEPTLDYGEAVEMVGSWYAGFYRERVDAYSMTLTQIEAYERIAGTRARVWVS